LKCQVGKNKNPAAHSSEICTDIVQKLPALMGGKP